MAKRRISISPRRFFAFVVIVILGSLAMNGAIGQQRALDEQATTETRPMSRLALLICNSEYDQQKGQNGSEPMPPLRNPCRDVDDVASVLERNDWKEKKEYFVYKNQSSKDLWGDMQDFKNLYLEREAAGPVFAFIYYAGHGMQIADETYLFGTEAKYDPKVTALAVVNHRNPNGNPLAGSVQLLRQMIYQIGDGGEGSIFVVIDACRKTNIDTYVEGINDENLRSRYFQKKHGTLRNLRGVKFLFSTTYGDYADDGAGANSPFAEIFVRLLKKTGLPDDLTNRVVDEMPEKLNGKQTPWTFGSVRPPPPTYCLTKVCGEGK